MMKNNIAPEVESMDKNIAFRICIFSAANKPLLCWGNEKKITFEDI